MIDNMQTQTDHFRANPVFNAPADAAKPSQVDEILGRLDELQDLVAEELEVYRNASIPVSQEAPSKFKLSVVIPVYNEKETILRVIARIAALPLSTEIIVVDDCSTDLSLRGMPVFRGLIGPIPESKTVARYESPEVFEIMTKEWAAQKSRRRRRKSTVPAPAGGAIITGAATSITISVSETV